MKSIGRLSFVSLAIALWAGAAANAGTFTYRCACLGDRYVGHAACGPRGPTSATLKLSTRTATFASTDKSESFRYDPSYQGGGAKAGYVRYIAPVRALLVEKTLQTGGYALHSGGKGGYLHYTSRGGDGYDNVKYICRAR